MTFQSSRIDSLFPFGTGVSRVDRDGKPPWFRFDYSHHWSSPIRGDEILVPAMSIGEEPVAFQWPEGDRYTLDCRSKKPHRDSIRFLDGDGQLVREISVLDAVLQSRYAAVLQHTTDGCDPLHLNFVDLVGDELPSEVEGVDPGDLIVSMRNISAVGFIDPQSGLLKRLVRGTFIQQHSVQHLADSRFLMFDNQGGSDEGGSSRLLEVDLATGAERTVFPTAAHSDDQREIVSRRAGHLSISPDRERLIVNYSYEGIAFEIRLSDGEVLREFRSLHDVSGVDGLTEERREQAAIFRFFGMSYVARNTYASDDPNDDLES